MLDFMIKALASFIGVWLAFFSFIVYDYYRDKKNEKRVF